jgi:hypothetical protein
VELHVRDGPKPGVAVVVPDGELVAAADQRQSGGGPLDEMSADKDVDVRPDHVHDGVPLAHEARRVSIEHD